MMTLTFQEKKEHLESMSKLNKAEIINIKNLSDSLSVSKNSIKKLFDELLREKKSFKYIISVINILLLLDLITVIIIYL